MRFALSVSLLLLHPLHFSCPNNPLKLFVDSHLKFFCGEFGPAYLGESGAGSIGLFIVAIGPVESSVALVES